MGNVSPSQYGQYGDDKSGLAPAVVMVTVEASTAFFVLSMVFYCLAHWLDWLPRVYSCRSFLIPQSSIRETPKEERHPFSWLVDSWPISDRQVLRTYGLDALLFLRSLRLQAIVVFIACAYSLAAVLPVNMSGHAATASHLPWGSRYTTMNLGPVASTDAGVASPVNSRVFLVHVFGAYLIVGVTLWLLWREYKGYVELRHQYLTLPQPQQYTIMVDHIPSSMRSNYAVSTFFEHLFPNSIKKVTIMLEMEELDAAIAQRDKAAKELDWARAVQADHEQLRCHWFRSPSGVASRVCALTKQLPLLEAEARSLQQQYIHWHCRHERISKQASHHVTRLDSDTIAELADALATPDGPLDDNTDNARPSASSSSSSSSYFVRSGSTGGGGARLRASIYDHTIGALSRRREGRGQGQGRLPKVLEHEATLREPLLSALLEEEGLRDGEVDEGEEEGWGDAMEEDPADAKRGGSASPQPTIGTRFAPPDRDLPPASLAPSNNALVNHLHRARKDGKPPSAMRKLRERTRDTIRLITGNPVGSTAFVSFRSLAVAAMCGRCMTYSHPLKMIVSPAPQPEDILWENISMPMRQRPIRTILGTASAVVITIFFSVPVGIIAGFTNVETLRQHVPFIRHFLDSSSMARTLLPYLPPFILVLVDNLIPPIFSAAARVLFREVRLVSQAHNVVFGRLYGFLLYNNFLILFLSSSLNTYYAILENPHDTLVQLGNFLPQISSFYVAYILIKALAGLPMELTRCSSYCVAVFRYLLTDDLTEAQRADRILGCNHLSRPGGFYYGRIYADNLFVFSITMTFSLVAPLILPVSFLFFFGALVVYKRQLLFVYEDEFESGGAFWPRVYTRMVIALYFMQVSLLCILLTNTAFKEVAYVIPLPIITHFVSDAITRSYRDAAKQLPLSLAMEIDRVSATDDESYDFLTSCYIQPSLRPLEERVSGMWQEKEADGEQSRNSEANDKAPGGEGATHRASTERLLPTERPSTVRDAVFIGEDGNASPGKPLVSAVEPRIHDEAREAKSNSPLTGQPASPAPLVGGSVRGADSSV